MEEKYLIWHIEGGLGKNVASTSLLKTLKEKYVDRKIIIVASYPDIFINNPHIYRVYRVGNTQYFYDDYIKDRDTIIFRHEPYYETNHINKRKHLIENWCELLKVDYENQLPELHFNLVQERNVTKWMREKPIMIIQTNGGPSNSEMVYSWTRDIPFDISLQIADKYREEYHIIQVCKPSSRKIPNVEVIDYELSNMELFSLLNLSTKRILIDSCLQHVAAAFNLESSVLWIGTSPKVFGYTIHDNIVANTPTGNIKHPNSYLFDYSFDGFAFECPYYSIEEMFDINKLLEKL
jgi:signal peptidase I